MAGTGNVFMDAFLKAGVQMEGEVFKDWESKEDFKFPFSMPSIASMAGRAGYIKLYNFIRRTSKEVTMGYIYSNNSSNTNNFILTWIKGNLSMLRIVDSKAIFDKNQNDFWDMINSDVRDYATNPLDYRDGLAIYIEYNVLECKYKLHINESSAGRYNMYKTAEDYKEILNWCSVNRDKIEFIPIIANSEFIISSNAHVRHGIKYDEVKVPYEGNGILNSARLIKELDVWLKDGNVIKPENMYYIYRSRRNPKDLFLMRADKSSDSK